LSAHGSRPARCGYRPARSDHIRPRVSTSRIDVTRRAAAILMPLLASYLVKAYAWRSIFGGGLPATVCTLAYP
jgi:hypothetical protein